MRTRIALAILFALLVGLAVAQVPYHNSVVWRAQQWQPSGVTGPLAIGGIAYDWLFTDMPTNGVVATNWVDKVKGALLTQQEVSRQPTNTFRGVYFGASSSEKRLTNLTTIQSFFGGSNSCYIRMTVVAKPGAGGTHHVLSESGSATTALALYNQPPYVVLNSSGGTAHSLTSAFDWAIGTATVDLVCASPYAGYGAFYTNGVLSYTGAIQTLNFYQLGRGNATLYALDGYIKEIAMWTNKCLTLSEVQALRAYSTNAP